MAVLDLQGLKAASADTDDKNTRRNSGSSKGCNNHSGFSLLLCG